MILRLIPFLIFFSFSSFANLDISAPRGSKIIKFSRNQKEEICVIPQHKNFGSYSDKDLKTEEELCSYDFSGSSSNQKTIQVALCPKLNSTNPGVLVMEIPNNWDRNRFESEKCSAKNELQDTEAKFKQTITCSYAPSILTYYHFSRFLNGAGRVPVAVLRTMDKSRHSKIVSQGLQFTKKIGGAIHSGWSLFEDAHRKRPLSPLLFDSTEDFLYGALQENIKNEAKYYEIIGTGNYNERYANFLKKDFYSQLAKPLPILDVIGSRAFEKVAQSLYTLKDASDLILLDTLLNQQDRMYNQHFRWIWLWIEDNKISKSRVKAKIDEKGKLLFQTKDDQEEKRKYDEKKALLIKEMVLKDNDCGVRFPFYANKMKQIKALDGIRHMSGKTYKAFLKLASSLREKEMQDYLKSETLMNESDLKAILENVFVAQDKLRNKCLSGELRLDLDLELYFNQSPEKATCDPS